MTWSIRIADRSTPWRNDVSEVRETKNESLTKLKAVHTAYGAVPYALIELDLNYDGAHTTHGVVGRRFDVTAQIELRVVLHFCGIFASRRHGAAWFSPTRLIVFQN